MKCMEKSYTVDELKAIISNHGDAIHECVDFCIKHMSYVPNENDSDYMNVEFSEPVCFSIIEIINLLGDIAGVV